MKKEFYIGQPLIAKDTGERVTFAYDDGELDRPYNVLKKDHNGYYEYEDLEPSTEFNLSQIIAGLEQGYFEVGTEFIRPHDRKITIRRRVDGLCIHWDNDMSMTPTDINSTWTLVGDSKEMTLEEIEAELGYKVKLKNYV